MTPTPETDAQYKEYARRDNNVKCVDIDFAYKLERERDDIQNELNKCATQLVLTINSRDSIGVQLDLIRDELLRIMARIAETGLLAEHHGLRSIFDYCQRSQKEIEVLYTPIQERDKAKLDLACALRERDSWKAKAERTCRWDCKLSPTTGVAGHSTECGSQYIYDPGAVWCKLCGGRIVRHL